MFSIGCLLVGHDDIVVRNAGRIWLHCHDCGRDTPGWRVGPTSTADGRAISVSQHCRYLGTGRWAQSVPSANSSSAPRRIT